MFRLDLNGKWAMKRTDSGQWIDVEVPGTVFNDLLEAGMIEDPFYRDNEDRAMEIASHDYEYRRTFFVPDSLMSCDRILLCCDGLDTFAGIVLNGECVSKTANMHRIYEFNIKRLLKKGENVICITIYSPLEYVRKKQEAQKLYFAHGSTPGNSYIRKAHYMFGWDWGPKVPDCGIWRNIYITGFTKGRLKDVYITQKHTDGKVDLDIAVSADNWSGEVLEVEAVVVSPAGQTVNRRILPLDTENRFKMGIGNPELWWPNGYGDHPLYRIELTMRNRQGVMDSRCFSIGLRTLTVKREKDEWGEAFEFNINGISIFAMGANYIPGDNILARCTPDRSERLIKDCADANFNCLRVWGGGIYPEDYFYDLCDRHGIIVWQDLMFACNVYDLTDEFRDSVVREVEDNVRRLRHHACLGLWCGNNELEAMWTEKEGISLYHSHKLKTDYLKLFEIILPELVKSIDPNTFYWLSSPSSTGGFDDPNNENTGDSHYWDVWHGMRPIEEYGKHYFRFCSEFGFESFPCMETVKAFTLPEDRNMMSFVMEKHQKRGSGNAKMLYYLTQWHKYPCSLESLIYVSQILQAEAMKYGVEHWRRNRGRCMGALYWQLDDCWPALSWSSIDYSGRWKALHYYVKRFYSPVLISACEKDGFIELYVTNDTMHKVNGEILWQLVDNSAILMKKGSAEAKIDSLSAGAFYSLDLTDVLKDEAVRRKAYLCFKLVASGSCVSEGTLLFVKPKHFEFVNPCIEINTLDEGDRYIVYVKAVNLAKCVELYLENVDCKFDDNFFDIPGGEIKRVCVNKGSISERLGLEQFNRKLKYRTLFGIN